MDLTRDQMYAALYAARIQREADERDLPVRQLIAADGEPGDENVKHRLSIFRRGARVLRSYVVSWSDEYCSRRIPENAAWAKSYGAPSYCVAFCLPAVTQLAGETVFRFAFFSPIAYQAYERRRWHKVEQIRLLNRPSSSLQLAMPDGGLVTVDLLDDLCCMLCHLTGETPHSLRSAFIASCYRAAEEMVALEQVLGCEFEIAYQTGESEMD